MNFDDLTATLEQWRIARAAALPSIDSAAQVLANFIKTVPGQRLPQQVQDAIAAIETKLKERS